MRKPKLYIVTLSPVLDDGSRKPIIVKKIATFEREVDAYNVKRLLEKHTYKEALMQHSDYTRKIVLTVER